MPGGKEDNCANLSVPDSSGSDKEATLHGDSTDAVAGAEGKVNANVGRKAKGSNCPNSGRSAAGGVDETYAKVLKKPKGDHQAKDQSKAKRQ